MLKKDRADIAAEQYLDIEMKHSGRQRTTDIVLTVICCVVMFALGIGIFIGKPDAFSSEENRTLQGYPEFTIKKFLSGKFTSEISSFYSDQFPFRNKFVMIKGATEIGELRMENNDTLIGRDDYLIKRIEYGQDEYEQAQKSLEYISEFERAISELGVDFYFALAPRSIDIMDFKLPDQFSTARADTIWKYADQSKLRIITFNDRLKASAMNGEYVWFKTDHHWTARGAYIAYLELAAKMGFEPIAASKLTAVTVSEDFRGTTYSSSGIKWTSPDILELLRYDGDSDFTVRDAENNTEITKGFYDYSYLEVKDKYSIFVGGNNQHVSITHNDGKERPKLLLIKDSFAHSVVPFLAEHYDIEMFDLRYYKTGSVYKYAAEHNFDAVLVLYGIDTIATSDSVRYIKYGIK